jgi:hypothetical protein
MYLLYEFLVSYELLILSHLVAFKVLLLDKLEQAQNLLSDVYHEACDAGLTEVESQMSCADSCICEALSELDR